MVSKANSTNQNKEAELKRESVNAPISLFVYNRLGHTRRTVEALQKNVLASKSDLIVFSDGPTSEVQFEEVQKVRQYIRQIDGFKSVTIVEQENNRGLACSIIDGVTHVCNKYGRVVVLEDDLVTSPYFLKYMNEGLEKYQDEQRVISIHAYIYPTEQTLPETFFLKGADCWGWATWKRGWQLFDPDGQKLLDELKRRKLTHQFDFDKSYPYTKMLQNQIAGKNNSWAIRWYASAFLQDKLTLYPGRSLVHNIGLDGSGTHCSAAGDFYNKITGSPISVDEVTIDDNVFVRQSITNFHKQTRPWLPIRAANKVFSEIQRMLRNKYGKST